MRLLLAGLICITMSGCAVNPYKQFYVQAYKPDAGQAALEIQYLKEGEEPRIIQVSAKDYSSEFSSLLSQSYLALGYSGFIGVSTTPDQLKSMARSVGATVVVQSVEYAGTTTSTRIESVGTVSNTYGSSHVSGDVNAGIYGSSTTYGTQNIPVTDQYRTYEVKSAFFAKYKYPGKFGVIFYDLTPEKRQELERNTGALVGVVVEGKPAFYSNILPGDLIVEVGGKQVLDKANAIELLNQNMSSSGSFEVKVIRSGSERTISVSR